MIFLGNTAFSQFIRNPSFEGNTGMSTVPPGWSVCDEYSTPDTQPGVCEENDNATDGNTYLSLLTRGNLGPYAGHCEDIQTQLLEPLIKGECYSFNIDLKRSTTYGHDTWEYGWISYTDPVIFEVYGGNSNCAKTEMFIRTEAVTNTEWQTYDLVLNPTMLDIDYLILKVDYVSSGYYFGNLQLDNIRLSKIEKYSVKLDTTINYGEVIQLNASNADYYIWNPETGLSCTDCQSPFAELQHSMIYTAEITKSVCVFEETFIIKINPFIPNILTPNGDNKNDIFFIDGLEQNSRLIITNRYGDMLYESDNYDNSWNAIYRGSLLPEGTYWYSLRPPVFGEEIIGFIYIMY